MTRQGNSATTFLSPPLLIILIPIATFIFLLFAAPPILTFSSLFFRSIALKKSWDSLNIFLVVFALLCGVFARLNDGETDSNSDNNVNKSELVHSTSNATRNALTSLGGGPAEISESDQSANPQPWLGFSGDTPAGVTPLYTGLRKLRRTSTYPESTWENREEVQKYKPQFLDDFEIDKYHETVAFDRRPRPRLRPRSQTKDRAEAIPVETVVRTQTASPSWAMETPPPPPPPPPSRKSRRKADDQKGSKKNENTAEEVKVDKLGRQLIEPPKPPPPPPQPPRKSRRKVDEQKGKKNENMLKELKVDKNSSRLIEPPKPPPPPPQVPLRKSRRNADEQKGKNYEKLEVDTTSTGQLAPPKPPPPPPQPPPSPSRIIRPDNKKLERRKSNVKKEIATALASLYNQSKRKKKHTKTNASSSIENYESQPTPPPTPPPLPPPPSSVFHNLFKKASKNKRIHSVPPPPPPPPPQRPAPHFHSKPPLPAKPKKSTTTYYDDNTSSGGHSPLIPIPPPPPPPFNLAEWTFDDRGDYTRIQSAHSSVCGSPESDDASSARVMDSKIYCPSPDVNLKADTFIARLYGEWRLEKMNSLREKRRM